MARPRMPKTVKVGPHTYKIILRPAKQVKLNGNMCMGMWDPDTNKITICTRLELSLAQDTLLHEILHACMERAVSHHEHPTSEICIDNASPYLLQTLQENPELVKFLLAKE